MIIPSLKTSSEISITDSEVRTASTVSSPMKASLSMVVRLSGKFITNAKPLTTTDQAAVIPLPAVAVISTVPALILLI